MSALALLILAAAVSTAPQAEASTVSLSAEVGVNGVGRPGRWAPVRVTVHNDGSDLTGELVVIWGDSRIHRAVALTAPSRTQFELYMRPSDVRGTASIALRVNGAVVQSVEVPVRLAGETEAVIARFSVESAPRSWRGYDAADDVEWTDGGVTMLTPDRREAFSRWQAIRRLKDAGALVSPTRVYSRDAATPRTLQRVIAGYAVVLFAACFAAGRSSKPRSTFLVAFALTGMASTAALAWDRLWPADVIVRHQSVIHALDGTSASLVLMRGVAVFPSYASFSLHPILVDASIDNDSASMSRSADDAGPVMAGTFGLDSKQGFALEGATDFRLIQAARIGEVMRISNSSRFAFRDCRVSNDHSMRPLGALPAGASADIPLAEADGATVSCVTLDEIIRFTEPRHQVRTSGTTRVLYRILQARDDRS